MKRLRSIVCSMCICLAFIQGCSTQVTGEAGFLNERNEAMTPKQPLEMEEPFDVNVFNHEPTEWGENVTGVKTRLQTEEKEMALTFDACGGDHGGDVDKALVSFLRAENIPVTLFVNERWIFDNEALFLELARDPLFQIENHGTDHAPLSVDGGKAWGIKATESPQEAYDEIMQNHDTVQSLTGKKMSYFRSGTAYYDEVAVQLAEALGYEVVNFDILGDAGATYTSEQVEQALLQAQAGSIALMHMNQPGSGTAEGVMQAIPQLRERGFEFVLLEDKQLE